MKMTQDPDIIPVDCTIPPELHAMMEDYVAIANHLISYGIYHKVGIEKHYYPIANTDTSGKPKPIPPFRELRDQNKEWFNNYYGDKYASHYLNSTCSFAMQQIKSWRTNGGDITATPHIRKPIARLDNDLFTIKKLNPDGTMKLRITIAPYKSVIMNIKVNHRHFSEWSQNRAGTLVIVPYGLRLCFTDDEEILKSPDSVAYDFNFNRVVMARSDGQVKEVDLSDVMAIQKNHKAKRESVQKTMAHNPAKAERILRKQKNRERNRVEDLLHKKIHGKNNEILSFVGKRHLGVEDLRNTTKDILKTDNGKKFNVRMSSWIHGTFAQIIQHHHPDNNLYYTRGTSRWCPFCNSQLTHPTWKKSKCLICNTTFDRDRLEAVSGLVRTNNKHKKGEPWKLVKDTFQPQIESKLLQSSMMIRGFSSDNVLKSVSPECAILSLEEQSDIGKNTTVPAMQENRNEAFNIHNTVEKSNPTESKNDANSSIDTFVYKR